MMHFAADVKSKSRWPKSKRQIQITLMTNDEPTIKMTILRHPLSQSCSRASESFHQNLIKIENHENSNKAIIYFLPQMSLQPSLHKCSSHYQSTPVLFQVLIFVFCFCILYFFLFFVYVLFFCNFVFFKFCISFLLQFLNLS